MTYFNLHFNEMTAIYLSVSSFKFLVKLVGYLKDSPFVGSLHIVFYLTS